MTETATYKELHRSRSDRMLAGVCGGLGEYFNVNPVFYRVGFVILTLLGGAGILVYGACALVIPAAGERESVASDVLRNHRQRPIAVVGLLLVVAAGVALLSHMSLHFHSNGFWGLVLVVGAVLIWAQRRSDTATPTATTPTTTTDESGATTVVAAPTRRRRRPFRMFFAAIGLLVLAFAVLCAVVAGMFAHLSDGAGNRNFAPATPSSLDSQYKLGVGNLTLDLSGLKLGTEGRTVHLKTGIGHIHVIVPPNTTVRVIGNVDWGDSSVFGNDQSGHDVRTSVGPDNAQIVIDAHISLGQIEVDRA
jgi:phage shock protein PspC (stress-responsive transcriptional regulator)